MVTLKNTNDVKTNGVKILVYGAAGVGKTRLIATMPDPVILSAEAGLLSIAGSNIPVIEISSFAELQEAWTWLSESEEGKKLNPCLDSLSEIGETILSAAKKKASDPRQAYGAMQDDCTSLIRAFRDLPGRHVCFTAKLDDSEPMNRPSMPGKSLTRELPYFFDEVFAVRAEKDGEGNDMHIIQTSADAYWTAKDRSGKLEMWTPYDTGLDGIIERITA